MPGSMMGKTVLITGGMRGLGKAIAELLAREGAAVWVTSRQSPEPERIESPAGPGEIRDMRLEVTREDSVRGVFRRLAELHGRLDLLVNNAGIGVFKPIEGITADEFREVMETNVTGLFLCSREAFALMKRQGGGRIVNLSSVAGYMPIADNGAYGASKYAVRGLSHIMNEEGLAHGIRVSVISAGIVYTDICKDRPGMDPQEMLTPEDIAETVLDIARRPLHVRVDEVKVLPPKGVL